MTYSQRSSSMYKRKSSTRKQ